MTEARSEGAAAPHKAEVAAIVPTRQYDAQALLGDEGLAEIRLGEQRYLLRLTKAGKLILTK